MLQAELYFTSLAFRCPIEDTATERMSDFFSNDIEREFEVLTSTKSTDSIGRTALAWASAFIRA